MDRLLKITLVLFIVRICESRSIETTDSSSVVNERPNFEQYQKQRAEFIEKEEKRFLGADLNLSDDEKVVNKHLMKLKQADLDRGFNDSHNFIPARNFLEMLEQTENSQLFQFIRRLPKGGIMHAHLTALGSNELILNATYLKNLWQKGDFDEENGPKFKFARDLSTEKGWQSVAEIRNKMTADVYDSKLNDLLSLNVPDPINAYKSIDTIWKRFESIFTMKKPLVSYEPVWRQYYLATLQQLYDDKVNYLEFRAGFPKIYTLKNNLLPATKIIQAMIDDTEAFKKTHPDFLGVKMIYTTHRFGDNASLAWHMENVASLHKKFPDFVVGFDLVGQEDPGKSLLEYAQKLLQFPKSINFFFHAGETNWFGMKTDFNLVDAVLLGTKRVGHGFALIKHPSLLEEFKRRRICVELNPISNQVLKLVEDYRNHPGAVLFSDNYPVVVSSDDPAMWRATPLSHDFYIAFLGIASAHHDLRLIKQLALNSIEYSAMNQKEKDGAREKWLEIWNKAMKELAQELS